jgi:hypothetical protein
MVSTPSAPGTDSGPRLARPVPRRPRCPPGHFDGPFQKRRCPVRDHHATNDSIEHTPPPPPLRRQVASIWSLPGVAMSQTVRTEASLNPDYRTASCPAPSLPLSASLLDEHETLDDSRTDAMLDCSPHSVPVTEIPSLPLARLAITRTGPGTTAFAAEPRIRAIPAFAEVSKSLPYLFDAPPSTAETEDLEHELEALSVHPKSFASSADAAQDKIYGTEPAKKTLSAVTPSPNPNSSPAPFLFGTPPLRSSEDLQSPPTLKKSILPGTVAFGSPNSGNINPRRPLEGTIKLKPQNRNSSLLRRQTWLPSPKISGHDTHASIFSDPHSFSPRAPLVAGSIGDDDFWTCVPENQLPQKPTVVYSYNHAAFRPWTPIPVRPPTEHQAAQTPERSTVREFSVEELGVSSSTFGTPTKQSKKKTSYNAGTDNLFSPVHKMPSGNKEEACMLSSANDSVNDIYSQSIWYRSTAASERRNEIHGFPQTIKSTSVTSAANHIQESNLNDQCHAFTNQRQSMTTSSHLQVPSIAPKEFQRPTTIRSLHTHCDSHQQMSDLSPHEFEITEQMSLSNDS